MKPASEWPVIAGEPTSVGALYSGYIIPLAAIPAIAGFIGRFILVHNIVSGLVLALLTFVLGLVSVYIVGLIAALAPPVGGVNDQLQGLKWAAYSNTAAWLAGIANVIPIAGALIALLGALYSLYLFYLGASPMMKVPQDKVIGYAVVVIICNIVVNVLIFSVVGFVVGMMAVGAAVSTGAIGR